MDVNGIKFLNRIYSDLQHSKEVKRANLWESTKVRNKDESVKVYMNRLERIHGEKHLDYIKHLYHERYVITEDKIKEKYYEFLDDQYWEQYGEHMTEELRKEHVKIIIRDQKNSLDNWIDYFSSTDSSYCPMWAKYWAFQGMLKIGSYNQRTGTYQIRKRDSVAPFIELDREILATCIELIVKYVNYEQFPQEDLAQLISSGNFMKLYTCFINRKKEQLYNPEVIEGKWVKYNQGSDYTLLYNSLQGYHTGWCTAGGQATCEEQIEGGDFYVTTR